jgi:uncharacterized BrkB/YihY/UPF0761 family membrane protein
MIKKPPQKPRPYVLIVGILAFVATVSRLFRSNIQMWEKGLSPVGGAIALATIFGIILAVGLIYLWMPTRKKDA